MSTRGTCGFRKNGIDKLTYNHSDSYPSGLGADIVDFCLNTSIEDLNKIYDRLELIDKNTPPTLEQIQRCRRWTNLNVSSQKTSDWYCLLREAQGNFGAYKDGLCYMVDGENFIKDSLFCEYGYIINLDDNVLEFWTGFQKEPQENNRYGIEKEGDYFPCKMALTFPLNAIPINVIEKMQTCDDEEENENDEDIDNIEYCANMTQHEFEQYAFEQYTIGNSPMGRELFQNLLSLISTFPEEQHCALMQTYIPLIEDRIIKKVTL